MAFNWQTFKTRTLTAAIFVVVMLAGLLINQWTFFVLFSVIHYGCWWEYFKLVEKIHKTSISNFKKFLLMNLGYVLFWLIGFGRHETPYMALNFDSFGVTIRDVLLILIGIGSLIFFFFTRVSPKPKWMSLAGLIYISVSLGFMMNSFGDLDIHSGDTTLMVHGVPYFFASLIIASLWINDTMAYIIGSLIGKTQMSEISPKKTWEGTIAGVLLSGAVIFLVAQLIFHLRAISFALMVLSIIASITGTIGDLFESKLKRMAGVKDSGHIMPGHGGFLDRFDSLIFATPFVWLYVYFFMR